MTPDQLDKWSKKRAIEIVEAELQEGYEPTMRTFRGRKMVFAGMAAASVVYELVGRIRALKMWVAESKWPAAEAELKEAEAKLKALLEGK